MKNIIIPKQVQLKVNLICGENKSTIIGQDEINIFIQSIYTVNDIVQTHPTFIINLEKDKMKLTKAMRRVEEQGFQNIIRFPAINMSSMKMISSSSRATTSTYTFNTELSKSEKGCALSHILLWEYMILNDINIALVFEDDIIFHETFQNIFVDKYFPSIPSNSDIVYMGWQRTGLPKGENIYIDPSPTIEEGFVIKRHPATTHAYIITLNGAKKLLKYISLDFNNNVYDTIDIMMAQLSLNDKINTFAFNGKHYPPSNNFKNKIRKGKDLGICFQDKSYLHYIDQEEELECSNKDCIAFRGTSYCPASSYKKIDEETYKYPQFCKFSKNKIEFIHIPKNGGSVITKTGANFGISWSSCHYPDLNHAFKELNCPDVSLPRKPSMQLSFTKLYEPWHIPGKYLKPNPYAGFTTFTVVRNPLTRIISAYYCRWNGGYKLYRKDIDNTPQMHLNDWIKKKLRNWPDEDRKDSHLTPQYMFVYNNNNDQVVEYVLKYEQLEIEFNSLMRNLGFENLVLEKEKINAGIYDDSKLNVNDLDADTIALIMNFYEKDFKLFGYGAKMDMGA